MMFKPKFKKIYILLSNAILHKLFSKNDSEVNASYKTGTSSNIHSTTERAGVFITVTIFINFIKLIKTKLKTEMLYLF